MSLKSDIVIKHLKEFPNSSKRAIAEKIFAENELLFSTEESVRCMIRYYTGSMGNRMRRLKQVNHTPMHTSENPYGLPESDAQPFEPYIMPKANNNILFLTDIHLPYHDIKALTLALDYGKEKQINTIYLNGDIMDCYQASDHEKDPRKRDLKGEIDVCKKFLDILAKEFPKAKIFWHEGNHCVRWERYLRVKAPILLDMEEFRLPVIMKLAERGITWIPNKQITKMGKLNSIHGNQYKGGGGINVARTLWLRAGDNVIAGDKHKVQSAIKSTIDGKIYGTWSVGHLGEKSPDYLPLNEWSQGFAHIIVEKDGNFTVKNYMIIDGKIH